MESVRETEQIFDEEADLYFDRMAMEEEEAFRNRYKPLEGVTLNGQQLYTDTQTDDIVDCNGQPINSCDALSLIDGVKEI
jgi:hypothetical protein